MDISKVKRTLNKKVTYNGVSYIFTGCIFRLNEKTGKFFYQAELKSMIHTNSLVICKLEDIEEECTYGKTI